jgi:hypothetical protein
MNSFLQVGGGGESMLTWFGISLAVLAVFNALFLAYINATTKGKVTKVADDLKVIKRSSFFVEHTTKAAAIALQRLQVMEAEDRALIDYVLRENALSETTRAMSPRQSHERAQDVLVLQRAIQMLVLFAHGENDDAEGWRNLRRNAIYQLSEGLGDVHTLDELRALLPLEDDLASELKSAIGRLKTSLNNP